MPHTGIRFLGSESSEGKLRKAQRKDSIAASKGGGATCMHTEPAGMGDSGPGEAETWRAAGVVGGFPFLVSLDVVTGVAQKLGCFSCCNLASCLIMTFIFKKSFLLSFTAL